MKYRKWMFRTSVLLVLCGPMFASDATGRLVSSAATARNGYENELRVTREASKSDGTTHVYTNSVVELKNGQNRFDENTGNWIKASEHIELVEGAALARGTAHQVIFSANLNDADGTVDFLTPDKLRLRSQVIGIAYTEKSTGKSVFVAEIQDSTGELHGENIIVYPDGFDLVQAEVRYTHSFAGIEQDVILQEKLPAPEEFGLDSRETYP